jgi:serine protease Do
MKFSGSAGRVFVPILLWVGIFSVSSTLKAQGVFEAIGQEVNTIFEKAAPAVVRVRADQGGVSFVGTGFFIDGEGTLLTAFKILQNATTATVEFGDKKYEARVLGRDLYSRLAMLKIEAKTPTYLRFANQTEMKTGQSVISVGFPFDLPSAPSFGMISGLDVTYQGMPFATRHLRANVALSPGQIGGPLLNTRGEVVGVIITAIEEGKACYAIPAGAAQKIASDFRKSGAARHGWVGVDVVVGETSGPSGHSIRVRGLRPGTPAEKSGLQAGDVILKIGDRDILQPADLLDAAFFSQVGQSVKVSIWRDGKTSDYQFTVSERPVTAPMVVPAPNPESLPPVSPSDKTTVMPVKAGP